MEIKDVKIDDLKPAEYNPRQMTEDQADQLTKSIERFGLVDPIIVNSNPDRFNVVIGGHQRLKIAKIKGFETVPVYYLNLDIEKEKELNLRLNKNNGEWAWDILANNFEPEFLFDIGFKEEELGLGLNEDPKDDEIPEIPVNPQTKLGDLYELGPHRILCGDSMSEKDVDKLMKGDFAKIIFTSPPYNMGAKMYENYEDNLKSEEYIDFNLNILENFKRYLKGFVFWNISYNKNSRQEFIEIIYRIIKETGLKFLELIVWNKKHTMPITSKEALTRQYEDILVVGDEENIKEDLEFYFCGRNDKKAYFNKKTQRGLTNYWEVGTNKTQLDNHKACFPVALPVKAMLMMSSLGDIISDPFLGSGTTLIASEKSKRVCYGMELDPAYVDVCIERYCNYKNSYTIKKNGQEINWKE